MAPGAVAYTLLGIAGRETAGGNVAAIGYGLFALGLPHNGSQRMTWRAVSMGATLPSSTRAGRMSSRRRLGLIREARNLPVGEQPQRLHELGLLRKRRVVLVCHTDKRSAEAAAMLSEAGFQEVLVLRGGMVRWNEAGLPVTNRLGEHRAEEEGMKSLFIINDPPCGTETMYNALRLANALTGC